MKPMRCFVVLSALAGVAACAANSNVPAGTALPFVKTTASSAGSASGATLEGYAKLPSMNLFVGLRMRDERGLLRYAASASDPRSATYRHFLTPAEIGERFGATRDDQQKVVRYFRHYGLRVSAWPSRNAVVLRGTQAQVERAFSVRIGVYRPAGGRAFYAPIAPAHTRIALPIAQVIGLRERPRVDVMNTVDADGGISGNTTVGYAPQQIAGAFDYRTAYARGYDGAGIAVGVIATGPFLRASAPLLRKTFRAPGRNAIEIVPVIATAPPITSPACTGSLPACNPDSGEPNIDTQQIYSLAYGARVLFYLAYDPQTHAIGSALWQNEMERALNDDVVDALSLSFGLCELEAIGNGVLPGGTGIDPTLFAMAATEGIAVFVSSGDSGADACAREPGVYQNRVNVSYPSSDANVVAVGGVTTPVSNAGVLTGPITGWGLQTAHGISGGGGGVSYFIPQPSFQRGARNVIGAMRNVPDIALDGDSHTGVAVMEYGGTPYQKLFSDGGTSVAAPESAAMWALVLGACKATPSCARAAGPRTYRLGNPNPLFYEIYAARPSYKSTFYDVIFGDDSQLNWCQQTNTCPSPGPTPTPVPTLVPGGYRAGPGYDRLTGVGVPFGWELIQTVLSKVER